MTEGWRYYNHALIPTLAPHEKVDSEVVRKRKFWSGWQGHPLMARWVTDFDVDIQTEWWYVIKDDKFDINALKAKRRYEINKGKRNFDVKLINPFSYVDEMVKVMIKAYSAYPEKYRPDTDAGRLKEEVMQWTDIVVFGGFSKEDGSLCGFAYLKDYGNYTDFNVLRTIPEYEKLGINAAIINGMIEHFDTRLGENGFYISDGSRSVVHETAFQDYLEKYFGFRKAYCNLKIYYRFPVSLAVRILYPFRKKIGNERKLSCMISGLLRMEEIQRKCKYIQKV